MSVSKKIKLPLIIVGSVVAALALTALILGLIPINPIKRLPDNYTVTVSTASLTQLPMNEDREKAVADGIDANKFSVLHGLLEYKYNYAFTFKTQKNSDGKKERVKYYNDAIKNFGAGENSYLLTFSYTEPQTVKIQGETVTFDRVKLCVRDMQGEIEKVDVLFYLNQKIDSNPVDEYYYINPVEVHMASSKLYAALQAIEESL